jgi:hypothetical protein
MLPQNPNIFGAVFAEVLERIDNNILSKVTKNWHLIFCGSAIFGLFF